MDEQIARLHRLPAVSQTVQHLRGGRNRKGHGSQLQLDQHPLQPGQERVYCLCRQLQVVPVMEDLHLQGVQHSGQRLLLKSHLHQDQQDHQIHQNQKDSPQF